MGGPDRTVGGASTHPTTSGSAIGMRGGGGAVGSDIGDGGHKSTTAESLPMGGAAELVAHGFIDAGS